MCHWELNENTFQSFSKVSSEHFWMSSGLSCQEPFASLQVVDNTGTLAPRSLVAYGASDVYYVDETGVRSLRTRETIDSAYASDVGSAIDPFVQSLFAELGADAASKGCAVIEAVDGRYMLALGRYRACVERDALNPRPLPEPGGGFW